MSALWRNKMYAIVTILGKQFKAVEGRTLRIPKMDNAAGDKVTFDKVLLFNDGKSTQFGSPTVAKATVTGTVLEHGRERKVLIYKKKRRKGYQRKNGHRQHFTEVEVNKIQLKAAAKKKAPAKKAKAETKPAKEKKKEA